MPQLLNRPPVAPNVPLPQEPPNRPLGQDWLSDAVDGILGGLGIANPFNPSASKAVQIGGMIGSALPFGKLGTLGKAAEDAKQGFSVPHALQTLTGDQMDAFIAGHGGTAGAQAPMRLPAALPSLGDPLAHVAPPQTTIAPRPAGPWDSNAAPNHDQQIIDILRQYGLHGGG